MTAETRGPRSESHAHNCIHSFPDLGPRVSAVISHTSVIKPINNNALDMERT